MLLAITVLAAGCKVAVVVVQGGKVQSIGSGTCLEGDIRIVDVNEPAFDANGIVFAGLTRPDVPAARWAWNLLPGCVRCAPCRARRRQ